jgi:hypothetical protein
MQRRCKRNNRTGVAKVFSVWFAYIHCQATDVFSVLLSDPKLYKEKPQLSDNNQDLVVSPKWVLCSKTDWPADRRS